MDPNCTLKGVIRLVFKMQIFFRELVLTFRSTRAMIVSPRSYCQLDIMCICKCAIIVYNSLYTTFARMTKLFIFLSKRDCVRALRAKGVLSSYRLTTR